MRLLMSASGAALTALLLAGCTGDLLEGAAPPSRPGTPGTTGAPGTTGSYRPPVPLRDLVPSERPTRFGWAVGEDDVVLTVGVHEGYGRSEIVSFDSHGNVVRAADTSVNATTEDYTTWRLDRVGLRRVLQAFDRLGVREADVGDFGDSAVGPGQWQASVGWTGVWESQGISGSIPAYDERPELPGYRLWALANQVIEPAWHGDHVVEGPRQWVPRELGVRAGPPDLDASPEQRLPYAPWPLDRTITELSQGVGQGPYSPQELLCLRGRDAARVFRLLKPGVNTAWLRVDDGRRWEVNVEVVLPAYVAFENPCVG